MPALINHSVFWTISNVDTSRTDAVDLWCSKKPLGIKQFIKLIVLNNAVSHRNAACLRVLAHHTNGQNDDAEMILTKSCNY